MNKYDRIEGLRPLTDISALSPDSALERASISHADKSFDVFHSDASDHIFRVVQHSGQFYEIGFLSSIARHLQPGDLVVDVGANIGNHTLFFAGVRGCRVACFEPGRTALSLLAQNVAANGLAGQVEIWPFALAAASARYASTLPAGEHNLGALQLQATDAGDIQSVALDSIAFDQPVKLIKIDVEGMELDVLRGARDTIARDRPVICVECDDIERFDALFEFLQGLGFLVTESHNYTATHVFVAVEQPSAVEVTFSRLLASRYIDNGHEIHALQNRERTLQDGLKTLQARLQELQERLKAAEAALHAQSQAEAQRRADAEQLRSQAEEMSRLKASLSEAEAAHQADVALLRSQMEALRTAIPTTFGQRVARLAFKTRREAMRPFKRLKGLSRRAGLMARSFGGRKARRRKGGKTPFPFHLTGRAQSVLGGTASLAKASPIGGARVDPRGWIWFEPSAEPETGVTIGPLPIAQGGLFRARIELACEAGAPALQLSVWDDDGRLCGPSCELANGENTHTVFVSLRMRSITLKLTSRNVRRSGCWHIKSIALDALDADTVFREQRQAGLPTATASLASIPSRREMLADCVGSLLPQVDKICVFLNGYDAVPDFLRHQRIEVRRSQDWDDRGDAGKFFWIAADDPSDYRLIVDDDLIFPPDFTAVMAGGVANHGNRAIFGAHGVLLRQPIVRYYDASSRTRTFHFASPVPEDRTVHILGTNALCFHRQAVRMQWADFLYRNSADIWLARYAQQNHLPMVTPARPWNWVREGSSDTPIDTIFDHSQKRSRSAFDSSFIQDAALKRVQPITFHSLKREKVAVCVPAADASSLTAFLDGWSAVRSSAIDWVLVLAPLSEEARKAALEAAAETEVHILAVQRSADEALDAAHAFAARLKPARMLLLADDRPRGAAVWDGTLLNAISQSAPGGEVVVRAAEQEATPFVCCTPAADDSEDAAAERVAPAAALLKERSETAWTALAACPGFAFTNIVIAQLDASPSPQSRTGGQSRLNQLFQRIVYLNLDRRPDRRQALEAELAFHGIKAERFAALDGLGADIQAEYAAYVGQPLREVSGDLKPLWSEADFFMNYDSQAARVAFQERKLKGKAIRSAGAWAYLRSWEKIIEQALDDGIESLLILDDDVLFHRDMDKVLAGAMAELPQDWLVLRLGTLQYDWNEPWMRWASDTLYRSNGHAVGSHAVGLRFDAMIHLLDRIKTMELPVDVGALAALVRDFNDRSFVVYPNVAIQSLSDSDISTSNFQQGRSVRQIADVYRWKLEDYGASAAGFSQALSDARQLNNGADAPDYVADVLREKDKASLTRIKLASTLSAPGNPVLICVMKNERQIVEAFLRHYRDAGIERFIIIDNGSTDGTLDYLAAQADVELYRSPDSFEWRQKQGWINHLIANSDRPEGWFLYADADELMVFDGLREKTFADLAAQMDARGITRCRGMLVDMYAQSPLTQARYEAGASLIEAFPYFDAGTYAEAKYQEVISRQGGPRKRAFGQADDKFNPELTKYPLFRLRPGEVFANPHHIWPYDDNFKSPCHIGILHFKFLPGLMARVLEAIERQTYWNGSLEYRCYSEALSEKPDLSLHGRFSEHYTGVSSLVEHGIVSPPGWQGDAEARSAAASGEGAAKALGTCAPIVSVIIPVHNVEAYLRDCLDSVFSQTLANIEVILVDDCSQDGSRAIAERAAVGDPRVTVLAHAENGGVGPARNTGVQKARGTYLFFLDSDDVFAAPSALAQLVSAAQKRNCQVVIGSCEQLMPDGSIVEYDRGYDRRQDGRPGTVFRGEDALLGVLGVPGASYMPMRAWGTLIERSYYNDLGLDYPPGEHEDMAHTPFLYFAAPDGVLYEKTIAVRYRVRQSSLSRTPWPLEKVRRYGALWRAVVAQVERFGLGEKMGLVAATHALHLIWRIDNNGLQPGADSEYRAVLLDILQHVRPPLGQDLTVWLMDRLRHVVAKGDAALLAELLERLPAALLLDYHRGKLGVADAPVAVDWREQSGEAGTQEGEALLLCDRYLARQEELSAKLRNALDACKEKDAQLEALLAGGGGFTGVRIKGRAALRRIFFRDDGRPVKLLRRMLFHGNGKPRKIFRRFILNSGGFPRKRFRAWMTSPDYLALRGAVRPRY